MAEITVRRRGELVRGVFKILKDHPEGLKVTEVLEQLERLVPPTDFEKSGYPNHPGQRRYDKIVRFSTISPVKAGWLVKEKGTWSLTGEQRRLMPLRPVYFLSPSEWGCRRAGSRALDSPS